jgi:hypothetical protein
MQMGAGMQGGLYGCRPGYDTRYPSAVDALPDFTRIGMNTPLPNSVRRMFVRIAPLVAAALADLMPGGTLRATINYGNPLLAARTANCASHCESGVESNADADGRSTAPARGRIEGRQALQHRERGVQCVIGTARKKAHDCVMMFLQTIAGTQKPGRNAP